MRQGYGRLLGLWVIWVAQVMVQPQKAYTILALPSIVLTDAFVGTWPYTYDTCDLGTFPNQTAKDGTPAAAATGGLRGAEISMQPGQKLSACTCPGSDHPGPSTNKGRGVPEIDILETQVDVSVMRGQVSQSFQAAPYNYLYQFSNSSTTIYDSSTTIYNTYLGGPYQQAVSSLTYIDSENYNGTSYATYGYEWWSDPNHRDQGYITWFSQGAKTWSMEASAIGPDAITDISQRLVPEEPMVTSYFAFIVRLTDNFCSLVYHFQSGPFTTVPETRLEASRIP